MSSCYFMSQVRRVISGHGVDGAGHASLKQGDVVHVAAGIAGDQGYVYGRNALGSMGWLPSSFVEIANMSLSVLPTIDQQEAGGDRMEEVLIDLIDYSQQTCGTQDRRKALFVCSVNPLPLAGW